MAGVQELVRADGSIRRIEWATAPGRPGWAKLDWLVGDRTRGILANASNVIDPTWEAPDGTIVPLDGFLDPYFQEVYLEAESIPLFTRLVAGIGADAVDDYVEQLEHEVWKYTVVTPNHGKAARRMYNVFRLSGRYPEAAYLRELFDEPVTALYQLAALLQTVADAAHDRGPRCSTGSCCWPRSTSSSCPPSRRSTGRTRRSWWSGSSGSGGRSRVSDGGDGGGRPAGSPTDMRAPARRPWPRWTTTSGGCCGPCRASRPTSTSWPPDPPEATPGSRR